VRWWCTGGVQSLSSQVSTETRRAPLRNEPVAIVFLFPFSSFFLFPFWFVNYGDIGQCRSVNVRLVLVDLFGSVLI
jgi:hypothetical protein